MIDTHAHLEACEGSPHAVLERARAAGVEQVLAVGSTIDSSRGALDVAESEPGVFAVVGIHPHESDREGDRLDELRRLLAHERAVAVGETGLDHYRDYAPRARQLEVFEAQLALAEELGKPAVIHTRAADRETVDALRRFGGTVVMHCFSSSGLLPDVLEHGWYVSFAGNVTFPKATELRLAAREVPRERLLAETDSPYLAPQPVRGRRNEPANVVHTYRALADARGDDPDELAAQIVANASRAFGLP